MIPVVLHGQTGCGKTRLLKELSERGFPVLDLESLANHRGSVFGQLNIKGPQPTQVQFEESIESYLANSEFSKFIFLEYEFPNLGKLRIPEKIVSFYKEGIQILLNADIHQRVQNILDEYLPADKSLLLQSLDKLKFRIETDERLKYNSETGENFIFGIETENNFKRIETNVKFTQLKNLLETEQYKEFCYHILEYYDNSKNYNQPMNYDLILKDREINIKADNLLSWMHERYITAGYTRE